MRRIMYKEANNTKITSSQIFQGSTELNLFNFLCASSRVFRISDTRKDQLKLFCTAQLHMVPGQINWKCR